MASEVHSGWMGLAFVVVGAVVLCACSESSDGDGPSGAPSVSGSTPSPTSDAAPDASASGTGLVFLVTNDDGVGAEGIDALVEMLREMEGVDIEVVAPADNQSGTGDSTTDGGASSRTATTQSGHPATAVEGFPADSVLVALDELGVVPDLVLSGINEGQNVGPLVNISGTVGAARTAARRGYPAVALSQWDGTPLDYEAGVAIARQWLDANWSDIEAGTLSTDIVVNINIPTCEEGELRGLVEVPLATDFSGENPLLPPSDCLSTLEDPSDDYIGMKNGFATLSEIGL